MSLRPVSVARVRLIVGVMGIAFLLGVAFWVVDGALNYYYFRTLLRTMIFEPPASLHEAVISHVSPYALRVRLLFMIACLVGGGIVVLLLSRQAKVTAALRQSEATLQSIFRAAPIGIGMVRDRVIVWTNEGLQQMVGYTADELYNHSSRMVYPSDQEFERVGEIKYNQIAQSGTGTMFTQFQHKDGTIIDVQLGSTALNPNDLSVGVIFTALDVSDLLQGQNEIRQLNRELEQRVQQRTLELTAVNHELEVFAYSVSHDLRAPLRSIEGFGRILAEDQSNCLDAAGQDALQRVLAASQRMGQMIDDLLTLSRTTQSGIVRSTVDLSAMVGEIAADLRAGQPERDVTWVIAPHVQADGDARLLRLALENLLGNAWKFTGKQPRATIEFGHMVRDGECVYHVRDDGPGFDMAYARKLFGAFQRLHSAAEYEGTGVGLATVQRIIRRHGGRVWADSAPGQGATFYFTLVSLESVKD